jgi:hypothetical protein
MDWRRLQARNGRQSVIRIHESAVGSCYVLLAPGIEKENNEIAEIEQEASNGVKLAQKRKGRREGMGGVLKKHTQSVVDK